MAENHRIIRFMIIDDHPMTRRGFGNFLTGTERFAITGEAASLAEGRVLLEGIPQLPDLIILDIALGDDNGLDFIGTVNQICVGRGIAPLPVLVYSVFEDSFRIQTAMRLGARGYISKSADEAELIRAIDLILGGSLYIDTRFELSIRRNQNMYAEFTQREREILTMIKDHCDNNAIAKTLKISLRTVENHLSHIYLKTGIKSREKLITL
jgi:NarL family two-component system response regulator LiaR